MGGRDDFDEYVQRTMRRQVARHTVRRIQGELAEIERDERSRMLGARLAGVLLVLAVVAAVTLVVLLSFL